LKNLLFRAPGTGGSLDTLVERAWPRSSREQRRCAIRDGDFRVSGEIVRDLRFRVLPGMQVEGQVREGANAPIRFGMEILQRGDDFSVVTKPVGWPSHATAVGGPDARTLVAEKLGIGFDEILPVHRLDADVGGVWLIAHSRAAAARLYEQFDASEVHKEYRAIVPALPWDEGEFRAGIDGKSACTRFRVVRSFEDICEVLLEPVTGRTHQLRAHLAGARAPILGDPLFGGIMVSGGLRLYCRRIAIESEGIDATAGEPKNFVPPEAVFPKRGRTELIRVSDSTLDALGRGHPWILTDTETSDVGGFRPGTLARIRGIDGSDAGMCRIEGPGRIAARRFSGHGAKEVAATALAALRRRSELLAGMKGPKATTAIRLVHGEADGLPGLAVDLLGDELRVVWMWSGCALFEGAVIEALCKALPFDPAVVRVRNFADAPKGEFVCVDVARGTPRSEPFEVLERGLSFEVDNGLSEPRRSRAGFGLFTDQRENRGRIAGVIERRGGGRWLNLFCHTGAFTLTALAAGADEVISVDLSNRYLQTLERNLVSNGLGVGHRAVKMDALRFIENLSDRDQFDGIILDPPTAASAGRRFWSARKQQAGLVEACFEHLVPGGCLLVCRNDHSAKGRLADVVTNAAEGASVPLHEVRQAPPSQDFPSLESFTEGDAFEGVIAIRDRKNRPAINKSGWGNLGHRQTSPRRSGKQEEDREIKKAQKKIRAKEKARRQEPSDESSNEPPNKRTRGRNKSRPRKRNRAD
jgi:23S rRNA (cytosine1962-C5)-methyltransferase